MNDSLFFVEVLKCLGHLDDNMTGELLAEVGQANDLMEQLATWSQLQNNKVIVLGLGKVDQLDNIGVVELLHNLNFFENVCPLSRRLVH